MREIDRLDDERYLELTQALDIIIDSEEIHEELENANYHDVISFLGEIRDSLCVHILGTEYTDDYGERVRECSRCGNEIWSEDE